MSRVTVTNSLLRVKRNARENTAAINNPSTIPKPTRPANINTPSVTVATPWNPPVATANMTINNATAVPSLNKLSPSNIIVKRFGAPYSLNNANTATGSVDDMIAANSNATMNGICNPMRGKMKYSAVEISAVEISNPTTASRDIAQALSSILRIFILNADSNIRIGKNM